MIAANICGLFLPACGLKEGRAHRFRFLIFWKERKRYWGWSWKKKWTTIVFTGLFFFVFTIFSSLVFPFYGSFTFFVQYWPWVWNCKWNNALFTNKYFFIYLFDFLGKTEINDVPYPVFTAEIGCRIEPHFFIVHWKISKRKKRPILEKITFPFPELQQLSAHQWKETNINGYTQ